MKMIVEVNVFVMPRHFNQFSGLTGLVVEYVSRNAIFNLTKAYVKKLTLLSFFFLTPFITSVFKS
jgi:hypothetical protein